MGKFKLLLLFILLSFHIYGQEERNGVTVEVPQISRENTIPVEVDIHSNDSRLNAKKYNSLRHQEFIKGRVLDSIGIDNFIPAGSSYNIKYNSAEKKLEALPPAYNVTALAESAIKEAPDWLNNDLFDIFRRIDTNLQNTYAQQIIDAGTQYRDEVAFQIAHLAPSTLQQMNPGLPLANVQALYHIAPDLQYVEVIEKQTNTANWYTTTKYRVTDSIGDTVWAEIPKEVYYWWIVMPKLSDEEPKMGASVYDEFWRSYLYNNADVGYPLLSDKLSNTKILWSGKEQRWNNKDSVDNPIPFHDSLPAVAVVGRWVAHTLPDKASSPRPIQPNKILHDHNGNCGELEDLLSSGARTALIPIYSVGTWPGDHVWGETYWPLTQEWTYYQVSWDCGPTLLKWNKSYPGKSCIAGWRADGYRWMVDDHYNDFFTLIIEVEDDKGKPVDGAEVFFFAPPHDDPHGNNSDFYLGTWGHTNHNGRLTVNLTNDVSYGYRVDWEKGHTPNSSTSIYTISYDSYSAGDTIVKTVNAGGALNETMVNSTLDSSAGNYALKVKYHQPYQTLYGGGHWQYNFSLDDYRYAKKNPSPGKVDFFISDLKNFNHFQNDSSLEAFNLNRQSISDTVDFEFNPDNEFFVSLANEEMNTVSQFSDFTVYLIDKNTSEDMSMNLYPNPFGSNVTIECSFAKIPEAYEIKIYDLQGRVISNMSFDEPASSIVKHNWQGIDKQGKLVSNGIYFIELFAEGESVTKRVISLKKEQ